MIGIEVAYIRTIEFWTVENTGWSGGISWFSTSGSYGGHGALRMDSESEAEEYIRAKRVNWKDPSIKWRIVHTTIEMHDDKRIRTETWKEVND